MDRTEDLLDRIREEYHEDMRRDRDLMSEQIESLESELESAYKTIQDIRTEITKGIGDKIYVNDRGREYEILPLGNAFAHLVMETDGSIRWYLLPEDSDIVLHYVEIGLSNEEVAEEDIQIMMGAEI